MIISEMVISGMPFCFAGVIDEALRGLPTNYQTHSNVSVSLLSGADGGRTRNL